MERRLHPSEVALVGVAAVWGLTFVMVQDAISQLPPFAFLAYRFLGAALVVAVVFRGALRALPRAGWLAGGRMGLFLTAGYVFQTFGLAHTSAANAGFITGLFVVLTPVCGLLLGQQPSTVVWAAALVAGAGLYLLAGGSDGPHWLGDGLEFLCACAFAAHVHATARGAARYSVGALLAVQLGVCGGVCLIGALATGGLPAPHGLQVWSALLVTALLASALGFFVQTYAQQHAPPTRTALILTSEPVFAGASSCLLQGAWLTPAAWLGAGLIMASIVGVELVPRLRAPRPLPEG